MLTALLRIGETVHQLGDVELRLQFGRDIDAQVEFDLFADTRKLTAAGFAINCMTVPGVANAAALGGTVFELDESDFDELNELGESVVCEPGRVLEIAHLQLRFGVLDGARMPISLEATCYSSGGEDSDGGETAVPVSGQFEAIVLM